MVVIITNTNANIISPLRLRKCIVKSSNRKHRNNTTRNQITPHIGVATVRSYINNPNIGFNIHSSIVRFARDYYKPRFDTEQVSDIKSALSLFGEDRQSHRVAGDFLYFTAKQKGGFDNREQIKARREVDNVVEGNYDQQQKRGFSMRR